MNGEIHEIIVSGGVSLQADLAVPDSATGIVVFVHGSGSSRLSPRNRSVASALRGVGEFGTLLFDLLTPEEDEVYANRFDIDMLTVRLTGAIEWLDIEEPGLTRTLIHFEQLLQLEAEWPEAPAPG